MTAPPPHSHRLSRLVNIGIPYLWLGLFFLLPFAIVLRIAIAEPALAQPPYTALWEWVGDGMLQIQVNLQNFILIWEDDIYLAALLNSLWVAFICTVFCLLLGYPMAYAIATAPERRRMILLMLIILPFWTSFLIRVYAWIGILKTNGLLNNFLLWTGLIDTPLHILHTQSAVYIGVVYSYLPFMILPLYTTLVKLDVSLLEASADLGARPLRTFLSVTLPLSLPGIAAGSALVFIPAIGEFVIPTLLGGPDQLMIGKVLWNEFYSKRNWPMAAAVAVAMLLVIVVPLMLAQRAQNALASKSK